MDCAYVHLQRALTVSWETPPPALVAALARVQSEGRGASVLEVEKRRGCPRTIRGDAVASQRSVVGAHRRDLACEGARAPARAARLLAAAARVEAAVAAGRAPTWPRLCATQRAVLGVDDDEALLRRGPAGCGDRRYGYWPRLHERLAAKLAADARGSLHPVLQATRLYLDLIHLHPFIDGNARAARLGLTWWLALAGLPLPPLDPLIRLPKPPGHPPWTFAHLLALGVARCLAPTGPNGSARSR